jgi:hypothetical protein
MTQKIKIGNLTVEVFFNEYDKKNKTQKQIAGHDITMKDRYAINNGLDDTDFGEFYKYENGDIEITGMFNVVDSREDELD